MYGRWVAGLRFLRFRDSDRAVMFGELHWSAVSEASPTL